MCATTTTALADRPDTPIVVLTDEGGKIGALAAERYGIPFDGLISEVDGRTWSRQRYCIRRLPQLGHGTYPTNTVIEDGTILTVCGKNHDNQATAIRWRLPEKQ